MKDRELAKVTQRCLALGLQKLPEHLFVMVFQELTGIDSEGHLAVFFVFRLQKLDGARLEVDLMPSQIHHFFRASSRA